MNQTRAASSSTAMWGVALLILLLGLWLRTAQMMGMPVQWLEGWSIYLAQNVMVGNAYGLPAESMRWLSGPFHAMFFPTGPEGIWLLRVSSALLGVLNIAICIRLGRLLDSTFAGYVAALFYVVLPFTVFHERQAIIDPIQAAFTSLALLFSVMLAKHPRLIWALLIGLCLGGAFLTKVSALPFLAIPAWAALLLASSAHRWRALVMAVISIVIALIVIVAGLAPFTRYNAETYPTLQSVLIDPFIGLSPADPEADRGEYVAGVIKSLGQAAENTHSYIGIGVTALTLLSLLGLGDSKARNGLLYLAVPALIFPLAPALSDSSRITYRDTFYAARYMLTSAVPMVVLAGISLRRLLDGAGYKIGTKMRWATGTAAVGSMLLLALTFDAAVIFDPLHAPLPSVDRWQYVTGRPSGIGYDRAAQTVLDIWQREGQQPVHVVATGNAMQLRGYLGPIVGEVMQFSRRDETQVDVIARWLAQGDTVLFFDGNLRAPLPENPHGAQLEVVDSYETRWGGVLRVYRVIGAEDSLAQRIAEQK